MPVSGKRSTVLAAGSRKVMPKAGLINKIAAFVADNQESAGAGLFSDCAARAVSCVINGAVEVTTGLSSDSALTGVITHSRHRASGVGAFYQRVPVFTVAEIDQRIFSRTQSSLAEHKSAVFSTMSPKSSSNTMPDF